MTDGGRWTSAALAACLVAAAVGLLAACSDPRTHAPGGASPGWTVTPSSVGTADPDLALSTAGVEAAKPTCTAVLAGSKVDVVFPVPDGGVCGEGMAQLKSAAGGDWHNGRDPALGCVATLFICALDRGSQSTAVAVMVESPTADDASDVAAASGVCRRLMAAGWTEDKAMAGLMPSAPTPTS